MAQASVTPPRFAPIRWLLVALLLVGGIALFLWHAPDLDPVAQPAGLERLP